MSREVGLIREILGSRAVARDGVLIVHSAFRNLSRSGCKVEAFNAALLDYMAGGTVLMPTMTWRTVTRENPVFDELKTPSHTGILTENFRTQFASHRSLHPTHSAAARGPLAQLLLSTHHYGTTPCAGSSPYGLVRDYDAHVLMLDVGLECCTAMHYAEEMMAPELYVRPVNEGEDYDLIDRHGVTHRVKTRRHQKLLRDFPKFEPVLAAQGALAEGRAGDTRWILFAVRDLYKVVFRALVERKEATLSLPQTA